MKSFHLLFRLCSIVSRETICEKIFRLCSIVTGCACIRDCIKLTLSTVSNHVKHSEIISKFLSSQRLGDTAAAGGCVADVIPAAGKLVGDAAVTIVHCGNISLILKQFYS